MIASSVKGKLLVFAVFFLGMVTGALVFNVYETRIGSDTENLNARAQRDVEQVFNFLGLSPEQRDQWERIMQDAKPQFDRLNEENRRLTEPNRPKIQAVWEETRDKIRAILTPEQRDMYNELNEKRRRQIRPSRPD